MTRRARRFALAISLATLGVAAGPRAAQADAAAQVLFDEGKKLMGEGKYAEACPKLEESERIDPAIGTEFNLAACYEQIGRTASAWSMFLDVAAASKTAGQPEREKVARQRANDIEPKLVRLVIKVPEGAPADTKVTRDGTEVGNAQWGTPVPLDPGKHEVTATATGKAMFRTTVKLAAAGKTETVTVQFDSPGAGAETPEAPPPPDAGPATKRRSTAMMVTGIGLLSLGAIAGVSGGVIIGVCRSGNAPPECNKNSVPAGAGLIVAGVVGLAVGIPLTIVGSKRVPVEPATTGGGPMLFIGPGSAAVRVAF